MATHSSVLAWRIPGTGEPGGLPSMGSHRVGHNWSDLPAAAAAKGIMRINWVNESIELTHIRYMLTVDVIFGCSIISNICHTHPGMT